MSTRTPSLFLPSADRQLGDRYQLLELLGDGSHGWVWRAERLKDQKIIALKIPKDRTSPDRDLREGHHLINAPAHENVVQIFWMGRVPPEKEWFAIEMEYFPITTLAQLLENRRRHFSNTYKTLFNIYEQVLAGVEYISNLNPPVSHGDIKPHNILIGQGFTTKLTDFGSSALPEEIYVRTRENGGTVLFSAPEYADVYHRRGSFEELVRGDVYSLGVLLYQLVTSRLPHDTPAQVRRHAPFPLPTEVNSTVCPELESVILKCLVAEPGNRWADVSSLQHAFREARAAQTSFSSKMERSAPHEPTSDWSSKALNYLEQKDYAEAAATAHREFENSHDAHALAVEIRALYRDDRHFRCIQLLEEHSDIYLPDTPDATDLRDIATKAYMKARRLEEAERILDLTIEHDGPTAERLLRKSSILGLKANYRGALDILTELNREFPGRPAILRRLVLVYEQLRETGRAMAFLKAYDKVSPNEAWTREKMEMYTAIGVW